MALADIWMPLYVGDYLADTGRLTTEQHGAYLLLLMDYWRSGALPDDDAALARIARVGPAAWRRLRPVLVTFFQPEPGRWRHKRVEAELLRAQRHAARASKRAHHAANVRWAPVRAAREAEGMAADALAHSTGIHGAEGAGVTALPGVETQDSSDFAKVVHLPVVLPQALLGACPSSSTPPSPLNPQVYAPSSRSTPTVRRRAMGGEERGGEAAPAISAMPTIPAQPGEWMKWFNHCHGQHLDPRSSRQRQDFWPLASAWCEARVSTAQMDRAIAQAQALAKGPIASLPAYADKVLRQLLEEDARARTGQGSRGGRGGGQRTHRTQQTRQQAYALLTGQAPCQGDEEREPATQASPRDITGEAQRLS